MTSRSSLRHGVVVALLGLAILAASAFLAGQLAASSEEHDQGLEQEQRGEEADGGREDEEGEEEENEAIEQTLGAESIRFRHLQQSDANGEIPPNALVSAWNHVDAMRLAMRGKTPPSIVARGDWEWLGPGNIGGRLRTILLHPTTPTTMWVGSVTGGIFKTTDGGGTWTHLDDFMSNLAVSSLVASPATPDTIYAATGENETGNLRGNTPNDGSSDTGNRGAGVFKSTDGGTSWSQLPATTGTSWWYTNRLAVSPTSATTLLAATWGGIFRTLNGGTSWTNEYTDPTSPIQDVDFDPTDGTKAIAGAWSGKAFYSIDGGDTWQAAIGLPAGGRVEVAYAPSNPSVTYASVDVNGGAIYRSSDGGHSYTLSGPTPDVNYLGTQGDYANALWVSPTNPDRVIVGGLDLYQSTNGGVALTKISDWTVNSQYAATGVLPNSAHADQHVIVQNPNYPNDLTVYFGNDGGIFKTSDVTTVTPTVGWQELNNNLGITQFYGADGSPTSGKIVGGTQDNGTLRYNGATETWNTTFGGDGGFSAVDRTNTNYTYGEYVYGSAHRSSNGGASAQDISGLTGFNSDGTFQCAKPAQFEIADMCNKTANFIAPIALDRTDPQRLLVGGVSLWRTNDARTTNTPTTGPTWASMKPPCACGSGGSSPGISAIAIDEDNPDLVFIGHNNGIIYRSTNATAVTPTWAGIDLPSMPARIVLGLTIDPNDPTVLYAMFGGFSGDNVWRLANGTWTDRTGSGNTGLPDVPARSLVVDPSNSNVLYLGTELGVFVSTDGGATWLVPNNGPANVPVDQLTLMGSDLVAATHGRGVWRASLTSSATPPGVPTNVTATAGSAQATVSWTAPASDGGSPITGYVVTPFIGATAQTPTTVGNVTSTTIVGLANGTTYTFRVAAVNAIGTGTQSAASNAVTPMATATAPGAPVLGSATPGNNQVALSWSAPVSNGGSPVTAYKVYRGTSSGAETLLASPVGTGTTYTDLTAANGTPYFYKVSAVNAVGEGSLSNEVSATPATVPGAPTGATATAGNAQATVSWSAPASNGGSAITNYVVTPFVGAVAQSATQVGNVTSTAITGLSNGTTYTFKVAAKNAIGTGPQSTASNAVTPTQPLTAPGAPVLNAAVGGNSQVALSWSAPASNGGSPVTGYKIYRATVSGLETLLATPAGTGTTYTDPAVLNGLTYFYKISAVNAVGEGPLSNELAGTPSVPAGPPAAPTNLIATPQTRSQIQLTWVDHANSESGFRIERSRNGSDEWRQFSTVGPNVTSYTHSRQPPLTTFFYRVRATNDDGESGYSNIAAATTLG